MVRHEVAQADQGFRDRVDGGGRPIAISLQELPDARLPHQIAGELQVERRQAVGRVAHHLHRRPSGSEHQERPERLVDRHAEDQLVRARPADHGLHREALDPCIGQEAADPLQHVRRRLLRVAGALQAEAHPADVRLVRDVVGDHLYDAGGVLAEQFRRSLADLGWIARKERRYHRYPIGCQQLLGLDLGQRRASVGEHRLHGRGCLGSIDIKPRGQRRRRAHQLFLRARVTHELHEPVDGLGRRGEAADALLREQLARLAAGLIAEPRRDHGLGPGRRCLVTVGDGCDLARRPRCSRPAPWGNS